MTKPTDIKAFSFLDRDPQAVASQLLRAGWPKAQVINRAAAVRAWASAIVDAFCAAEESQRTPTEAEVSEYLRTGATPTVIDAWLRRRHEGKSAAEESQKMEE